MPVKWTRPKEAEKRAEARRSEKAQGETALPPEAKKAKKAKKEAK